MLVSDQMILFLVSCKCIFE